jgi:predicted house-cleaning noncanonical NTP pyrophosphatase (MazG superfamily)
VLYTESVKQADALDFRSILTNKLREEYARNVADSNGEHFSNPLQMAEYLEDGVAILEWFKKRRKQYFSTKDWELVGIEIELCTQASTKNPSVYWYGFIDVVLRHVPSNKIYILDIKTSRAGWNKYQKSDSIKAAQLIAYKNYFSAQFGTPVENIDVEFFIVKRKLVEESMFPQKRIQQFKPAAGTVTQRKVQKQIDEFVTSCFDAAGNKNETREYLAVSGKGDKNCKYCPFKTDYANCAREGRIRE